MSFSTSPRHDINFIPSKTSHKFYCDFANAKNGDLVLNIHHYNFYCGGVITMVAALIPQAFIGKGDFI